MVKVRLVEIVMVYLKGLYLESLDEKSFIGLTLNLDSGGLPCVYVYVYVYTFIHPNNNICDVQNIFNVRMDICCSTVMEMWLLLQAAKPNIDMTNYCKLTSIQQVGQHFDNVFFRFC